MKRILVSCSDSRYFRSLESLVAGIHRTSSSVVDEILVFDLGLTYWQRWNVKSWCKTSLLQFPKYTKDFFRGYLESKQYAWKTCVMKEAGGYGDSVLYLDAGIAVLKSLKPVYDFLEADEVFVVADGECRVHMLTTETCLEIMGASADERQATMICAGIQGYRSGGRFQRYVDHAFQYGQIKECVHGPNDRHRHDQSIYSVLCHRFGVPRYQPREIYGAFKGPDERPDQVIYVHRGSYFDRTGLKRK